MSAPLETPSNACSVCSGRGWNLFIHQEDSVKETCPACSGTGERKEFAPALKWDAVLLVVAVLVLFALVIIGGHR